MLNQDFIRNLSQRAARLFPGATAMQQEIEAKMYALLKDSFERLNLVTREEFEAQLQVLERAQQTITTLEARVQELEQQLGDNKPEQQS
ncbi:MAG: accessory factor UbiK family protein [Pseudohongiellaceae bacterium]